MRKPIIAMLMAAVVLPVALVPAAASAQSARELRHDRHDIRQERRDVRQAYRHGTPRQVRSERRELRDARQEYREDRADRNHRWGRDDWQRWRTGNRATFARGSWRAPFAYTTFRPGVRIRSTYFAPRYYLADPWRYRLPPTYSYQRWVRHYDDLLLVDVRTGYVGRVIRGFFW